MDEAVIAAGNRKAGQNQEKAAQAAREDFSTKMNKGFGRYMDPNQSELTTTGTNDEQEAQLAGLNTAKIGYGQNLYETGDDIQRVKQLQRDRTNQSGADPVSAAIMNSKASSVANSQRSLAGSGIKGGAAAGAVENIARQKDADIAASLYGQQQQSIAAERSLASNTLGGTLGLMSGEKATAIKLPDTPDTSGTVICTELHRQGIMSSDLYYRDALYGEYLALHNQNVVIGYQFLAVPAVKLMQKSKVFTNIIKYPALSWANHIAGKESSLFGYACQYVGEPVCAIVGKIVSKFSGVKYA